ncbi:MAG: glycosyltransferase [Planctomycetota bacterium]|nr:glycosyltransferase [Planctomycetota bacterium]
MNPGNKEPALPAALKVAVIHDWITGRRGGEKVLEAILELFPNADVYTLVHRQGVLPEVEAKHRIHASWINSLPLFRKAFQLFFPLFNQAIGRFNFDEYDLVISISHCAAKNVRVTGRPHICYCLTPARYAWDLFDDYLKHALGSVFYWLFILPAILVRNRWRSVDKARSKNVSHFIAISKLVQDRIARHYDRESEILYPPVETIEFGQLELAKAGERFLVLSAVRPNKRVLEVVLACKALGLPLDVVGPGSDRALNELRRLGGPALKVHGFLSDEETRRLVGSCRALIHAATEDFGLSPVEAMAAGKAVIGYKHSGLADTVVDRDPQRTGVLFETPTVEGIQKSLERFTTLEASISPEDCRKRAQVFARDRFDQEFQDLVQRVLAEPAS